MAPDMSVTVAAVAAAKALAMAQTKETEILTVNDPARDAEGYEVTLVKGAGDGPTGDRAWDPKHAGYGRQRQAKSHRSKEARDTERKQRKAAKKRNRR